MPTAKELGRPLTDREKLDNLAAALAKCDRCDGPVKTWTATCPHCGYQLIEDWD